MADWDERYLHGEHISDKPAPLLISVLESLAPGLAPGFALDIACGAGRNSIFLAEKGWQVVGVDLSKVGIEIAKTRAREHGVELDLQVADLEKGKFKIEPDSYDLVCKIKYLQRDLFQLIKKGVRQGGIVVASIAMVDDSPNIKLMNPAFLLKAGELRAEFSGWKILHDYEGSRERGERAKAEIVAQRK